jgi:hypothetical protein
VFELYGGKVLACQLVRNLGRNQLTAKIGRPNFSAVLLHTSTIIWKEGVSGFCQVSNCHPLSREDAYTSELGKLTDNTVHNPSRY